MRYNKSKHLLLKKLSKKYIDDIDNPNTKVNADVIGLKLTEINSLLKVNSSQRELILSELEESKEIEPFEFDEKGFFINDNGMTSFVNKKYVKRNEDIIINWFKVFVQIVVPVLALVIAVLSLTIKLDNVKMQSDKELQNIKNIMKEQKKRIELLELNQKNLPNHKKNTE